MIEKKMFKNVFQNVTELKITQKSGKMELLRQQ